MTSLKAQALFSTLEQISLGIKRQEELMASFVVMDLKWFNAIWPLHPIWSLVFQISEINKICSLFRHWFFYFLFSWMHFVFTFQKNLQLSFRDCIFRDNMDGNYSQWFVTQTIELMPKDWFAFMQMKWWVRWWLRSKLLYWDTVNI